MAQDPHDRSGAGGAALVMRGGCHVMAFVGRRRGRYGPCRGDAARLVGAALAVAFGDAPAPGECVPAGLGASDDGVADPTALAARTVCSRTLADLLCGGNGGPAASAERTQEGRLKNLPL